MNRDIVRLNTVVDRFSKIGSNPLLKDQNVIEVIQDTVNEVSHGTNSRDEA